MRLLTAISALALLAVPMFGQGAVRKEPAIRAITDESWLRHLHKSLAETSMGKTWRLGPPPMLPVNAAPSVTSFGPIKPASKVTLPVSGSDLYRLNCQGCHGESGLGTPPEIGSLIDPVRATSTAIVTQRMQRAGMALTRRQIVELATQAKAALLKRLHSGGENMPPFQYLSKAEVAALTAYLKQLAGLPSAAKEQIAIKESPARVGELIVRSTCHICHDATGPNPSPAELFDGKIPSLSVLPMRVSEAQLVQKVTDGAPVITGGAPSSNYRGRMPVFSYLKAGEVADIYKYLTLYPPVDLVELDQSQKMVPPNQTQYVVPISMASHTPTEVSTWDGRVTVVLPICLGLVAFLLLTVGCWVTFREFRKLSVDNGASWRSGGPQKMLSTVTLESTAESLLGSRGLSIESVAAKSPKRTAERKIS